MERGIVTHAMDITSNGPQVTVRGGIPPAKLRYYALYWDKITLTDTNIFGTSLNDEQELLSKAKLLTKATARLQLSGTFDGSDLTNLHYQGLSLVATELSTSQPGQWSIHQSGDRLVIPDGLSTQLLTADFELTNCLPCPKEDVPLDKVLDFKMRRSDELAALRSSLDSLYLEIAKSQDIPRSKICQLEVLEAALADLDRAAAESWGDRILASRKVSIDLNYGALAQGVTSATVVGAAFASPLIGLVAGATHALVASVKFEAVVSSQLGASAGKQLDLSYLSSLRTENLV